MNRSLVGLATVLLIATAIQNAAIASEPGTLAVAVTVTEVVTEDVSPEIQSAGTVFSRNASLITAGLDARLEWVAEPGDVVASGEAVARFDCEMLSLQRQEQVAQAARARTNRDTLGREAERLEKLRETFAASITQMERIQADRDLAGSDLKIANVRIRQTDSQLRRCVAVAPFSGVVTEQLRRAGEDVERGNVIAAMTDTRNLEVRAALPVRYLPRVKIGGSADVRISGARLVGQVRTVVPAADAMSQTFEVRIDLPSAAPGFLAAGQLVSVRLPLAASASLTVPRDSIVLNENGTFVVRINADDTAQRIAIDVADAGGERVAIRGDLKPGDRIAVRGAGRLSDGELVAVQSDT